MKKKYFKSIKDNNTGSALIVSIIVLLFVSILATIMLYLSGVNFRMKKTDLNTRIAFYSAEIPLETMQSNLAIPLSYTMNEAYMATNTRYMTFAGADERREDFYNTFYDDLEDLMIDEYGGSAKEIVKALLYGVENDIPAFANAGYADSHIFVGEGTIDALTSTGRIPDNFTLDPEVYIVIPNSTLAGTPESMFESFCELSTDPDPQKCRILFKNIGVVVCQNGYRSQVTTDIAMQFPPLDWGGGGSTSTYEINPVTLARDDTSWEIYKLIYYINWEKS